MASIGYKNTKYSYGLIAIALHWIVAFAFIINYAIIYYRDWFVTAKTEQAKALFSYHTAIGISVIVFVVLRIIWRLLDKQPIEVSGSRMEHLAAHAAHIMLYAVMIILPLSGYLGTGGPSQLFFFIEIPRFADTQIFSIVVEGWMRLNWDQFEAPMDFIHKQGGAYFVWVLVAAHAGAALFHHFIRKDVVLKRMLWPIDEQKN